MITIDFAINFTMLVISLGMVIGAAYVLRLLPRLSFSLTALSAICIGLSGIFLFGISLSVDWQANEKYMMWYILFLSVGVALGLPAWMRGAHTREALKRGFSSTE